MSPIVFFSIFSPVSVDPAALNAVVAHGKAALRVVSPTPPATLIKSLEKSLILS